MNANVKNHDMYANTQANAYIYICTTTPTTTTTTGRQFRQEIVENLILKNFLIFLFIYLIDIMTK